MNYKHISRILLTGLCIAAFIATSFAGATGNNYGNNAQPVLGLTDAYKAMADPYAYNSPQSALDRADAWKEIQKSNYGYHDPAGEGNWDYWAYMWLDDSAQSGLGLTDAYRAMADPYAYNSPQSALDRANAWKEIQKSNYGYHDPAGEGNWNYWINMWLNEE
jgi:hypothetical protein